MPRIKNLLIILADDQGYGDAGCFGAHDLDTPRLDQLSRQGARCTQWYAGGAYCSPSRASLLTGLEADRAGVRNNVGVEDHCVGMRRDRPTMPELLRDAGYQTLMSGKWHLGHRPGCRPQDRGFEDWFGFLYGCVDYYSHIFYWLMADENPPAPRHDLWHNDQPVHTPGRYVMDLITQRAVDYLRRAKQDGRPFFLYLPCNAPHYPMHAPPQYARDLGHLSEARRLTATMMRVFDHAVGTILDELTRLQLDEETCVVVSSDHGPSREPRNWPDGRDAPFEGGFTAGLRGSKGQLYEGGLRVPTIWRWPGVTTPGSTVDTPMHHHDVLPTILAALGHQPRDACDGLDVAPWLAGQRHELTRPLRWTNARQQAVRLEDWKLIADDTGRAELYNLRHDPGEQHDLADTHRKTLRRLADHLPVSDAPHRARLRDRYPLDRS